MNHLFGREECAICRMMAGALMLFVDTGPRACDEVYVYVDMNIIC